MSTPAHRPQPEENAEPTLQDVTAEAHADSASNRPPRSYRRLLLKFLVSALWLVLLLEVVPRLVFSTSLLTHGLARWALVGYDESSWRLLWVMRHRLNLEQTITPATKNLPRTGEFTDYDATRGWAVKPGVRNMTPFGNGKYVNTNARGLRGATDYAYARTPGVRRILVLGDSFAFGSEVSDDETFAHDLETMLPKTEVLNLGVQGYGHDQMLLYLQQEGVKYRPDIVLIGFLYVDGYRNLWNFFAYAKPKFKLTARGLELTNVPVPTPEQVMAEEPYRSKALDLGVILREKIRWASGANDRRTQELTRALLGQIVATTRSIGAAPVLVYMPVYDEVNDLSDGMSERELYVDSFCHDQGIACLFLRPRFSQAAKQGVKLEARAHWNPEMHRMAAEEIARFLDSNGLIDGAARPGQASLPVSSR